MTVIINANAVVQQDAPSDTTNGIPNAEKGQAGGVATLDNTGKVPSAQLPDAPQTSSGVSQADVDNSILKIIKTTANNAYSPLIAPQADFNYALAAGHNALAFHNQGTALGGLSKAGQESTAIGMGAQAGNTNTPTLTPGSVALGCYATSEARSGVAIGQNALVYILASFGIALGQQAGSWGEQSIAIGKSSVVNTGQNYSIALGAYASTTGSYQLQLGSSSVTTYAYGAIQDRSDQRDKADIAPCDLGLDFINALQPAKWRWDYRDDYAKELFALPERPLMPEILEDEEAQAAAIELYQQQLEQWQVECAAINTQRRAWMQNPVKDGSKTRHRFHYGLIAQDVKSTLATLGIDWGGYQHHEVNGGDDVHSIGYMELIAPMLKAIQQLSARVQQLEQQS